MLLIKISYCQRISADVHALATFAAKAAPDDFWTTFFFCMRNPVDYLSLLKRYHSVLSKVKHTKVLASMNHLGSICPVIPNPSSPLLLLISTPRQPNQRNAQSVTQCIPTAPQWQAADTNFHSSSR